MTKREFATWVKPFAASYRASREETLRLARSLDEAGTAKPTGDDGWSVRDELVHIVASEDDVLRALGALLRGETVDTSIFVDIDARNARNLASHAGSSMQEIASGLEANGEALQDLLARLADPDESRQPDGFPFPLRGLVEGYGGHEPYHLGQIRAVMGSLV